MRRTVLWEPLMLHSEQDSWPAPHGAQGPSAPASGPGGPLMALAREIEETQRRQSSTLQHIVKRLRDLEMMPPTDASSATEAGAAKTSDEPWDDISAEALMQAYEAEEHRVASAAADPAHAGSQADWLGQPFHDVTQRIKHTLHTLNPGNTIALLEERLDQFQHHINLALEDVVRRADLDGLRRIEEHISDLGEQLQVLEQHVQRLDGIESDVRSVMEQVSDERLAKLLDYNARFAADLEAVALRAAEEVHVRFGQESAETHARRHEELTALIEASIQDRRANDTQASSLVADLSGHVTQQADRYGEIKAMLEETRREQRESEQTALGMLDTLQQALVRVLDRMDTLEQQHVAPPQPSPAATAPAYAHEPAAAEVATFGRMTRALHAAEPGFVEADPVPDQGFADYPQAATDVVAPPAEVPASFASPSETEVATSDDGASTIDRLRRDFIADARRAKLKAAANRAEAITDKSSGVWPRETVDPRQASPVRKSIIGGSGRLFSTSPKLLAGVLALIVAINGCLLLLTRKSDPAPAVPEIHVPNTGTSEDGAGNLDEDTPAPAEHSLLNGSGIGFGVPAQNGDGFSGDHMVTPYGNLDDVLNPPRIEPSGDTASAPLGTTIVSSSATQFEEGVANIYEQQVLAGLSKQLGSAAANHTPDSLLPELGGRIVEPVQTAIVETLPEPSAQPTGQSALDLPPATVGPLSLRLAAASGDASAEFEVAARLAEGKGTSQNYEEAARWYQRSATKGFAQSQYRLGTLYERGLGVSKDPARARIWYGRAAEQGNVKAMHNLAVLAAGNETAPDYKTALNWFLSAAEHGLADSQFNLGVLYEHGLGVAVDRIAAYKWYALAANGGDQDAKSLRDTLRGKMSGEDRAKAERLVSSFRARPHNRLANDALAAGEDWKRRASGDSNT